MWLKFRKNTEERRVIGRRGEDGSGNDDTITKKGDQLLAFDDVSF